MNCIANRTHLSANRTIRDANNGILAAAAEEERMINTHARGTTWQDRAAVHLNKTLSFDWYYGANDPFPPIEIIKKHHLFWTLGQMFLFTITCSDYLDGLANSKASFYDDLVESLEYNRHILFDPNWVNGWLECIPSYTLRFSLRRKLSGNTLSVATLLRGIRNRAAHHYEDDLTIRSFFASLPEEYIQQWLNMFPGLIDHLVSWALRNNLHNSVPSIGRYFESVDWTNGLRTTTLEAYPNQPRRTGHFTP